MQNTHCWIRFITYAALRVSCRVSTSYNTGRMKKEVGKVFSRITEAVQRGKDYIYLYFKPGSSPFGGVSAVCEYVFTQNSAIWTFYKRTHTHTHTHTKQQQKKKKNKKIKKKKPKQNNNNNNNKTYP